MSSGGVPVSKQSGLLRKSMHLIIIGGRSSPPLCCLIQAREAPNCWVGTKPVLPFPPTTNLERSAGADLLLLMLFTRLALCLMEKGKVSNVDRVRTLKSIWLTQ